MRGIFTLTSLPLSLKACELRSGMHYGGAEKGVFAYKLEWTRVAGFARTKTRHIKEGRLIATKTHTHTHSMSGFRKVWFLAFLGPCEPP